MQRDVNVLQDSIGHRKINVKFLYKFLIVTAVAFFLIHPVYVAINSFCMECTRAQREPGVMVTATGPARGVTLLRQLFSNVLLLVLRCNWYMDAVWSEQHFFCIELGQMTLALYPLWKSQGHSKNSFSPPTQSCQCLMCYVVDTSERLWNPVEKIGWLTDWPTDWLTEPIL